MSVQSESYLQRGVQKLVITRGGYIVKQHGSMITRPGIPDLLTCYKGFFIAFECKEEGNKPSEQQGVQCRSIQKAGGITVIVWSVDEAASVLDDIDYCEKEANKRYGSWAHNRDILFVKTHIVNDGTRY